MTNVNMNQQNSKQLIKTEKQRILDEYNRRKLEIPADYYSMIKPVNLFFYMNKIRVLLP